MDLVGVSCGESFVVEQFWEQESWEGDMFTISEPRLGMGGEGGSPIEGY